MVGLRGIGCSNHSVLGPFVVSPTLGLRRVNYTKNAGTVIPALLGAKASGDWSQVDAVVSFLRENDPHRAA